MMISVKKFLPKRCTGVIFEARTFISGFFCQNGFRVFESWMTILKLESPFHSMYHTS